MAEMSRSFNFDDFDEQIAEALEEHEQAVTDFDRVFYPGEIGGVAIQLSFADRLSSHPRLFDIDSLPDSPEADAEV